MKYIDVCETSQIGASWLSWWKLLDIIGDSSFMYVMAAVETK